MIYEYAIEPELLVEWSRDILKSTIIAGSFGLGKSRMMGEFPKKNKLKKIFKQACESSAVQDLSQARLEALYKMLTERMIKRGEYYTYNGEKSWIENAICSHKIEKPFKAIISRKNPFQKSNVLLNELMGKWSDEYWKAEPSIIIKKNAEMLTSSVAPLVHNSTELILVDQYFRAHKKQYIRPFSLMLNEFVKYKKTLDHLRVEIHISTDKTKETEEHIEAAFKDRRFRDIIPRPLSLKIKRWSHLPGKEKIHDRYLLTDIGGLILSSGFDENYGEKTIGLALLTKEGYLEIYRKYIIYPEFKLEHEFFVPSLAD
jgi:hypothetical protein